MTRRSKPIRVLIIGSSQIYSIENIYIKYLNEMGVDVVTFFAHNIFYEYYKKNLINKFLFRLGISSIYNKINNDLKNKVKETLPEIVWSFKGMEVFPETLQWMKIKGIKLINFNPDNPFIFSGKGSGNKNITDSIGLYDLHFTYSMAIKEKLENQFKVRTAILPFGFDIPDLIYRKAEAEAEILKVCFLGNPDKQRAEFIIKLAQGGVSVCVYGHGWDKFVKHPNIEIRDAVYGDEVWKVLRKYRVQLNLMRIHNFDSHNMRTFEVPGVGGIMVAPNTPDHLDFFENGREAFFFKTTEDCVGIIQSLLKLEKQDALKIRVAARNRSVASGYSYKDRANQVISILMQLNK